MNIFDPNQWAHVGGLWVLTAVVAGTLALAASKLAGPTWDDWFDQPLGHSDPGDDWTRQRA